MKKFQHLDTLQFHEHMKSVKSHNQCKSLPRRQAGVVQTNYDLVTAHGGKIVVESKEGNGTKFILTLSNVL